MVFRPHQAQWLSNHDLILFSFVVTTALPQLQRLMIIATWLGRQASFVKTHFTT
jgi:hypothetical protein